MLIYHQVARGVWPMIISWLSHDYLMIISWLSHDYIMTISWISQDHFMIISWSSHDYLMTISWLSHDYLMIISWLSHDYLTTISGGKRLLTCWCLGLLARLSSTRRLDILMWIYDIFFVDLIYWYKCLAYWSIWLRGKLPTRNISWTLIYKMQLIHSLLKPFLRASAPLCRVHQVLLMCSAPVYVYVYGKMVGLNLHTMRRDSNPQCSDPKSNAFKENQMFRSEV